MGLREPALARMMTPTIDFRNYILLGDPAVRIPIEGGRSRQGGPDRANRSSRAPLQSCPITDTRECNLRGWERSSVSLGETDLDRIRACIDYPVGTALPSYAALVMAKKWPNGSTLRVRFLDGDPADPAASRPQRPTVEPLRQRHVRFRRRSRSRDPDFLPTPRVVVGDRD